MKPYFAAPALLLAIAACGGSAATATPLPVPAATPTLVAAAGVTLASDAAGGGAAASFILGTTAFPDAGSIPDRYSCEGEDISPDLFWGAAPQGTESFVIVVDDPDAPGKVWDHWVVFNIPATTLGLEENQPNTPQLPGGGVHGKNSWGDTEYGGPCPPGGPDHTYRFFLYAVDSVLDLPVGASKQQVLDALEGHIVAESRLTGTYGR